MSGKSRRRPQRSPLGGYLDRARREFPDYVRPDARCDTTGCTGMVDAGRALTWVDENGVPLTVYVRLCAEHAEAPITDLVKLLPNLPCIDAPYIDLK